MDRIAIPHQVATLMYALCERNYRCYLVGECVRNLLSGEPIGDIDIITDAELQRLEIILENYRIIEENDERQEMVVMAGAIPVMISRFRSGKAPDGTIVFSTVLTDELFQRDFTINTICLTLDGEITDPFGGLTCLNQTPCLLKAVGEDQTLVTPDASGEIPEETSSVAKNPLFLLKALALMGSGDYAISEKTSEKIKANAGSVTTLPASQLREAFEEILTAKRVSDVFLEYSQVLLAVFPELKATVNFDQRSLFQTHKLYEHLCKSVGSSTPDLALRYALLFHGAGKPDCQAIDKNGTATYFGHAERSMIIARQAMERLEATSELISEVSFLITYHDLGEVLDEQEAAALSDRFSPVDLRKLILFACANLRAKSPDNEQRVMYLKKLADSMLGS